MLDFLLATVPVLIILLISEYGWRYKIVRGEAARKLVHIAVGSYVAFWPHFLSRGEILAMSLSFLAVVVFSQVFNVFSAIHGNGGRQFGEVLFAASIGVVAVIAPSDWAFSVAILHLSLADGMAGLVGSHWGRRTSYVILGHKKSLVGSTTFMVISFATVLLAVAASPELTITHPLILALIPFVSMMAENIGILGTDNLLVPLSVLLLLQAM